MHIEDRDNRNNLVRNYLNMFYSYFPFYKFEFSKTLKNAVFWDVTPCVFRLLVAANVPSSPILVTLMMETLRSSETSVLTRTTWHNIPGDGILHSHRCENLDYSFNRLSSVAEK
jgi:hypothetical protein